MTRTDLTETYLSMDRFEMAAALGWICGQHPEAFADAAAFVQRLRDERAARAEEAPTR